uniref:phospholipid scramblase 2 isoform X1 n=1 Tax=Monopterus albus TaxID=43700 RepID=UPI0009B40760|nr:phospholipid scramblase 2-like isoform X1 [Monopterus albus]
MNMFPVPSPGIPGCPPGLEYLTQVDQLLIKQKVELVEALVGFESNNKYEVRNSMGQNVFYAVEENDCLSRQCCGPMRSFTIHILNNFGQEVITIIRPLKCMSCFFPCCLQELEVQAPPGNIVGYIIQQWHPLSPKFIVANEHNEPVLKIHGPFCGWSCLPDVDFEGSFSCSEARNMFPIRAGCSLDAAFVQGMLLCGTVWPLFHSSVGFIGLSCEGIWVSDKDLLPEPREKATEALHYHFSSSLTALKSLLRLQNLSCCGSRKKSCSSMRL